MSWKWKQMLTKVISRRKIRPRGQGHCLTLEIRQMQFQSSPLFTSSRPRNQLQIVSAPESIKHRLLLSNKDHESQIELDTFTFVTYNVLAECYTQRDYATCSDPKHINADFRHAQIMQELGYLDGDIVCLQEVPVDFYNERLKQYYIDRGYKSHYIQRNRCPEGCAAFYRTAKFDCSIVELIDLNNVTEELFNMAKLDNETKTKTDRRYTMQDVAIILQLRSIKTGHEITVANTHIVFADFKKPDLQILQIACLKRILSQRFGGSPVILCGDFNMSPDSPQYIFTTTDSLTENQWEALQETAQIQGDLVEVLRKVIGQSADKLPFRSMYKHIKGEEPGVTCVDHIYRHCLDYVFCREQLPHIPADDQTSPAMEQNQGKPHGARSKLTPLQVLDTLPLEHVLKSVPPSEIYSSDHFPLFVRFAFET